MSAFIHSSHHAHCLRLQNQIWSFGERAETMESNLYMIREMISGVCCGVLWLVGHFLIRGILDIGTTSRYR